MKNKSEYMRTKLRSFLSSNTLPLVWRGSITTSGEELALVFFDFFVFIFFFIFLFFFSS